MAFLLKNSVFFHTPKTGGQWIVAVLEKAGLMVGRLGVVHSCPDEVQTIPAYVERPYSFAFVRHPARWYQSMWAHQMDESWEGIDDPDWIPVAWLDRWAEFVACRSDDFNEFVAQCVRRFPRGFVSQLFQTYTAGCTHIGKQEQIGRDLVRILMATGETVDRQALYAVPAKNVRGTTRHHRRKNRYNKETLDMVLNNEQQAIKAFQYSADAAELIDDASE